ncbi:MAG TPA: anti-sigma factor [Gemmatimonadales bacterium]|jgi:anti-sigma-K factor RskA
MSRPEQGSPRELAAAYALGALGPEETREFERFLATSPEAQREVDEYREVAALLGVAHSETAPGPELRARVLAKVSEESARRAPRGTRQRPITWAALAASLLLAVGLGGLVLSLRREITQRDATIAARDRELAQRNLELIERQALLDAILEPGVRLFQLTASGNPEPGIQLFWNQRRNEALLHGYRLQPVPPGRAYQLWFIRDGKPIPSVTFTPKPNGAATVGRVKVPTGGKISAAAITVEPSSGSQQPTSPILLTGTL